jgi:hypothetical protein
VIISKGWEGREQQIDERNRWREAHWSQTPPVQIYNWTLGRTSGNRRTPLKGLRRLKVSSYCTIYSPTVNYEAIVSVVRQSFLDCTIEITDKEKRWSRIIITNQDWTFKLSSTERVEPGDEFSHLILGTLNFFRNVETSSSGNKQRVMKLIRDTHWAIGIVVEPEFKDEAGHFDCIFKITELLGGLIFNGWGMVDENGWMILDKDGKFDEVPM